MTGLVWPADPVGNPPDEQPKYAGRPLRQLTNALWRKATSDRPLGAQSGPVHGSPDPLVTATATQWTVKAHAGALDLAAAAEAGAYTYSLDADVTGAFDPPDQTNPRIDLLSVPLVDPEEGLGVAGTVPGTDVIYTAGVPAANPAVPATPAGAMALVKIRVEKQGGGNPTVQLVAPAAVAAGGIQPLRVVDGVVQYPPTPAEGDYVDDPVQGLLRRRGGLWAPPVYDTGVLTGTNQLVQGTGYSTGGAQITDYTIQRVEDTVTFYSHFTLAARGVTATGDIGNQPVLVVSDPRFRPHPAWANQQLSSGQGGRLAAYAIDPTGTITLGAMAPGGNVVQDEVFTVGGQYRADPSARR